MVFTLGYLKKFKVKDKRIHPNDNLFTAKRKEEFIYHNHNP